MVGAFSPPVCLARTLYVKKMGWEDVSPIDVTPYSVVHDVVELSYIIIASCLGAFYGVTLGCLFPVRRDSTTHFPVIGAGSSMLLSTIVEGWEFLRQAFEVGLISPILSWFRFWGGPLGPVGSVIGGQDGRVQRWDWEDDSTQRASIWSRPRDASVLCSVFRAY